MAHRSHRRSKVSREQGDDRDRNQAQESTADQSPGAPMDFAKIGPRSIDGVEVSDLPDKGRGPIETDAGHELARKLPRQTGAIASGLDVGGAATPDAADARDHGRRGQA